MPPGVRKYALIIPPASPEKIQTNTAESEQPTRSRPQLNPAPSYEAFNSAGSMSFLTIHPAPIFTSRQEISLNDWSKDGFILIACSRKLVLDSSPQLKLRGILEGAG